MAVDFTEAQIQTQPVGPLSGGGPMPATPPMPSAVGQAASLFSSLMPTSQQITQRKKEEQARQTASVVERFSQQQLALAEAVDMGEMSSQEARMRMRANYSQAISDNPLFIDDITTAQKDIIGTSGLGKVVADGTEEEQRYNRMVDQAMSDGFVKSWMGPEEMFRGVEEWANFQLAGEQLQRAQAQLTYQRGQVGLQRDQVGLQGDRVSLARGQIGLQTDRIRLSQAQAEVRSEHALGSIGASYFQKFNSDIQDIAKRVESGELDEVTARRELDQTYAIVQNAMGGIGSDARSSYFNNMTAGFKDLYDSASSYITGEMTLNALEKRSNVALAIQTANITGDPETAEVIAASNVFRHPVASTLLSNRVNSKMRELLSDNSSEGVPANVINPKYRDENKAYLDVLKANMHSAAVHTLEEEVGPGAGGVSPYEEVSTHVSQVLKSISAYQSAVQDPSEFNDVVDFLASEEVREYATSGEMQFSAVEASNASQVLQAQYHEVIIPLVRQEWEQANVQVRPERFGPGPGGVDAGRESVSDLIAPSFSGGSFQFISSSDNARVRSKVRDLNRNVSPIVNRLLRSGAHLERHDNYDKIYRQLEPRLFGIEPQGE